MTAHLAGAVLEAGVAVAFHSAISGKIERTSDQHRTLHAEIRRTIARAMFGVDKPDRAVLAAELQLLGLIFDSARGFVGRFRPHGPLQLQQPTQSLHTQASGKRAMLLHTSFPKGGLGDGLHGTSAILAVLTMRDAVAHLSGLLMVL